MAKRESEFEHTHLLEMLGEWLYGQDVTDIRADTDGFNRPDKITLPGDSEGDTPDATAVGEKFRVYEVETPDSISDEHTERQWRLFATYATENNGIFYIVVHPMAVKDARKRVKELSLEATVTSIASI
ncbi:MAG: agmatine deiminase family protein [Deltaproteobacteria bacterium]|nr:agmatine deiminase family protein [Deltaproteobacteria bacterium]